MRLALLVSGRGSNLEAVLRAVEEGRLPGVQPALVISNRPGVGALDVAARHGIRSVVMRRADYPDAESRDGEIGRTVASLPADLVVLAGYDQLLRGSYFAAYDGVTINIHPSLLPAHGGRGMVGLAVHASVLASGDRESGATIHEVTPELDLGPILAQVRVPVHEHDDASRLAARVLQAEHSLLVDTLASFRVPVAAGTASARMTAGRVLNPASSNRSGESRLDA